MTDFEILAIGFTGGVIFTLIIGMVSAWLR